MLDTDRGVHTKEFWKYKIKEIVRLLNSINRIKKVDIKIIMKKIEYMSEDELIITFLRFQRNYRNLTNDKSLER